MSVRVLLSDLMPFITRKKENVKETVAWLNVNIVVIHLHKGAQKRINESSIFPAIVIVYYNINMLVHSVGNLSYVHRHMLVHLSILSKRGIKKHTLLRGCKFITIIPYLHDSNVHLYSEKTSPNIACSLQSKAKPYLWCLGKPLSTGVRC